MTEREELLDIYSDVFKSVYGFRDRSHRVNNFSNQELRNELDHLADLFEEKLEEEKLEEEKSVELFKEAINLYKSYGAKSTEDALRWMTASETFYDYQCVEHWVYKHGILFTDFGKEIVKRILNFVKFEEYT